MFNYKIYTSDSFGLINIFIRELINFNNIQFKKIRMFLIFTIIIIKTKTNIDPYN